LRVVIQRVSSGGVEIPEMNYEERIGAGLIILLGIKTGDKINDAEYLAEKCCSYRIFNDSSGKMNLSLKDTGGEVLVISQFTLYGDTARGNRPGFTEAAKPEQAVPLYETFLARIESIIGKEKVKKGIFGEMMRVRIINEGPVTIIADSK
jgi:D-aminoacyl-tRNA deacylase